MRRERVSARDRHERSDPQGAVHIGAATTVFARAPLLDLFTLPELRDSTISLKDNNEGRLRDTEPVARQLTSAEVERHGSLATARR
jgi:hypothetical protein